MREVSPRMSIEALWSLEVNLERRGGEGGVVVMEGVDGNLHTGRRWETEEVVVRSF